MQSRPKTSTVAIAASASTSAQEDGAEAHSFVQLVVVDVILLLHVIVGVDHRRHLAQHSGQVFAEKAKEIERVREAQRWLYVTGALRRLGEATDGSARCSTEGKVHRQAVLESCRRKAGNLTQPRDDQEHFEAGGKVSQASRCRSSGFAVQRAQIARTETGA